VLVAWLVDWPSFAVKGFWALYLNVCECVFVITVAMVKLLRDLSLIYSMSVVW
jgi:hypothetical protein